MNYLSNSINILVGDGPVPVKFGPKGTDSQYRKDARFTFHTRLVLYVIVLRNLHFFRH